MIVTKFNLKIETFAPSSLASLVCLKSIECLYDQQRNEDRIDS